MATLFLFHLDNNFLPFTQCFLDGGIANVNPLLKVGAGNFLEGQKAVTLFAVVYKAGLERRLDAGNDAFVNIAFTLFATGSFDINID